MTEADQAIGIDQATDRAGLGDKYDDKINKVAVSCTVCDAAG